MLYDIYACAEVLVGVYAHFILCRANVVLL